MLDMLLGNKMFRIVLMIFAMGLASYVANKAIESVKDFGES